MQEDTNNTDPQATLTTLAPETLLETLELAADWLAFQQGPTEPLSEEFQRRCDRAADLAYALARLSQEYEKVGFRPLSLRQYFSSLAEASGIALQPVLESFGGLSLATPDRTTLSGWARLGRQLGVELREMLIHLRLSLLEQVLAHVATPFPAPLTIRRRAQGQRQHQLDECEARLAQIEQQTAPQTRAEMKRTLATFTDLWVEAGRASD